MKFVELSVSRPVATALLTLGIALAGIFAFPKLAVSPLPQVDLPTIMVQAQMPGGSPEVMATSVTAPLERHLSRIADGAVRGCGGRDESGPCRLARQSKEQPNLSKVHPCGGSNPDLGAKLGHAHPGANLRHRRHYP